MKKVKFLLVLLLFPASLLASKEITQATDTVISYEGNTILLSGSGDSFKTSIITNEGDTVPMKKDEMKKSSVKLGGSSCNFIFSWEKKKKFDPHWSGFGLGFVGLNNLNDVDLVQTTSYNFTLNLMEYYIPIDRKHWLLVSGVGLDWSRYHFEGNRGLTEVNGITQFQPSPEGVNYNSSKLLAYYVTIPLLLEYQTRITNKQDFFISGGLVGYIRCYSKSQIEYPIGEDKVQQNMGRDLNILPINGRLMLQLGIEDVSVYGYYSPFSLFEKGKGPEIFPAGVGLMFNF